MSDNVNSGAGSVRAGRIVVPSAPHTLLSTRTTRAVVKQILPLTIGLTCVWLLWARLADLDVTAVSDALKRVPVVGWICGALTSFASFWAVGRYDTVVHRHLRTGLEARETTRSGMIAIALAQTLGFGVVTGALARWRLLPALGAAGAARISGLVAVSFLAGWAVVTSLACLLLNAPPLGSALAFLPLFAAVAVVWLALQHPTVTVLGRWPIRLPSLPALGAILGLTFLDTLFAALALYFLLPAELGLNLATLYPVFLIALGAALLSGTPGGVGPFELTLFALLPDHPEPLLVAGILGFRLIYYAIPAVIAGLLLLRGEVGAPAAPSHLRPISTRPEMLQKASRAELGVMRQNGGLWLQSGDAVAGVVETGQTLSLLFDPANGTLRTLLPQLIATARHRNLLPVLYKCKGKSALAARKAGFRVVRIAEEAVLNPTCYTLDGSERRQLRRMLRKAEKSGLRIERAHRLPLAEMERVDAEWTARQGGARGLSMGQFCGDYLAGHRVYLAWCGDCLMGFISFHVSTQELCLDLMRSADQAPDGCTHALIHAAIVDAAQESRTRVSLAAVPARAGTKARRFEKILRHHHARMAGSAGLTRFKSSFAPRFEPLYMAAPNLPALFIALIDIANAIRCPDVLHKTQSEYGWTQHDHAVLQFAHAAQT